VWLSSWPRHNNNNSHPPIHPLHHLAAHSSGWSRRLGHKKPEIYMSNRGTHKLRTFSQKSTERTERIQRKQTLPAKWVGICYQADRWKEGGFQVFEPRSRSNLGSITFKRVDPPFKSPYNTLLRILQIALQSTAATLKCWAIKSLPAREVRGREGVLRDPQMGTMTKSILIAFPQKNNKHILV